MTIGTNPQSLLPSYESPNTICPTDGEVLL